MLRKKRNSAQKNSNILAWRHTELVPLQYQKFLNCSQSNVFFLFLPFLSGSRHHQYSIYIFLLLAVLSFSFSLFLILGYKSSSHPRSLAPLPHTDSLVVFPQSTNKAELIRTTLNNSKRHFSLSNNIIYVGNYRNYAPGKYVKKDRLIHLDCMDLWFVWICGF